MRLSSSLGQSVLWLACLGTSQLAVAQTPLERSSRLVPGAETELADRKIEPQLREAFARRGADNADLVERVVIELSTSASDVRFDSAASTFPVVEVSQAVSQKQADFLTALAVDPPASTAFEVIDLLTLQYSLVAEVRDLATLRALAARADVAFVRMDNLNHLLTIEGRALTGSDVAAANGHDGAGIGVALIDTHFDLLHPELGGSTSLPNGVVAAGQNFSDPGTSIHSQTFGDCYHGTGTASIVRRYAPGVDLYCNVVFPNAYDSVIANAINWCVTNQAGVNGGAPIRVISMSLGGGRYYSECNSGTMHTAASDALSNGILVFAASGNDGWSDSMGSPACSNAVISVGSVWDENGAAYSPFPPANCSDSSRSVDERTCYSDSASFLDIYTPSEEVICAQCGGGTWALGGTSSACPAAAGLTAQLLDAEIALAGDKAAVVTRYQSTGATVSGDSSKRRINLTAAIAAGGGGGSGPIALSNGSGVSYSVATGATLAYTIAIPAGATNLSVSISGSGDADLYVKRAAISWPADQGAHDEAEFKAQYIGGSSESVSFAAPAQATWNVLIHGYSGAPSGSITASWETPSGGAGQLQNGVAQAFSIATGTTSEYSIAVPASASALSVSISGSGDADLYVKRASINWPGDQGAHNEAEFQAQYIGGSSESVSFTNPAQDSWNVLIHGYSGNPAGTIVANWTISSGPEWHSVPYARQTPHNYANNSTYGFTYSYPGASQVSVHFATLNTEANYDFLSVYDQNNVLQYRVSGNLISGGSGNVFGQTDGWVIVPGSQVRIELVTDYSVVRYGYLTDTASAYY